MEMRICTKDHNEQYGVIAEILLSQYIQKNDAYGNNMSKNFKKYGSLVYVLRISDKLNRLETLQNNPEISSADESILDTIGDAITYCMMCVGDIAASFVTKDMDSTINYGFTQELLGNISMNPSIVEEVVNKVEINSPLNARAVQMSYIDMLDYAYNSGELAQGCYRLAMRLLVLYAKLMAEAGMI